MTETTESTYNRTFINFENMEPVTTSDPEEMEKMMYLHSWMEPTRPDSVAEALIFVRNGVASVVAYIEKPVYGETLVQVHVSEPDFDPELSHEHNLMEDSKKVGRYIRKNILDNGQLPYAVFNHSFMRSMIGNPMTAAIMGDI